MSRLPRQLAELALAEMAPALVDASIRAGLPQAAALMAPVPLLGFEARLGAAGGPIDVSQRFRSDDGTLATLLRFVDARRGADPAWARLHAFLLHWQAAPGRIEEIWLEVDAVRTGRPLPSIFVQFRDAIDGGGLPAPMEVLADELTPAWRVVDDALRQARAGGLEPGRLLGLMLSRNDALRGTVRRPGPTAARALLEAVRWPGPFAALGAVLGLPAIGARDHQIVFDCAPALLPVLGIEILFDRQRDGPEALADVLAALVAQGWADAARADALRAWLGVTAPDRARGGWPDALIAADLADPAARASLLAREVYHLKLTIAPDVPPLAKGYFALVRADAAPPAPGGTPA